jgi:hypothetical protein
VKKYQLVDPINQRKGSRKKIEPTRVTKARALGLILLKKRSTLMKLPLRNASPEPNNMAAA